MEITGPGVIRSSGTNVISLTQNIFFLLIFERRTKVLDTIKAYHTTSRPDRFYYSTNRILEQVYQKHVLVSFFQTRYDDSVHE